MSDKKLTVAFKQDATVSNKSKEKLTPLYKDEKYLAELKRTFINQHNKKFKK